MKFHAWIVAERNKLARHAADPFELARVGTVLSAPGLSAPGPVRAWPVRAWPVRRAAGRRRGPRQGSSKGSPCCRRATSWSTVPACGS